MIKQLARTALPIGLLWSAQSLGQGYATRAVDAWTVAVNSDGSGCFVTREFDGEARTTLLLGLDTGGAHHLSVLNPDWSIAAKDRLTLDFRLSKQRYARQVVIGIASNGKRGFVTSFDARFPAAFAASPFLHIFRGSVPVEELSLAGSGAAVAELRRCVASLRPGRAADETSRSRRIPRDPFAPDAGERQR